MVVLEEVIDGTYLEKSDISAKNTIKKGSNEAKTPRMHT
jgi:hypothetical protein